MNKLLRAVSVMPLLCSGCSSPPDSPSLEAQKKLEKQVLELKNKLDGIEKKVNKLRIDWTAEKGRYQSIAIDPSSKGFSPLDTDTGSFLVALKEIQPYADGYKLKLVIGNPSSAQFGGFVIHAKWNKSLDKTTPEDWEKSQHEKDFTYTEKLMPGSWNSISLILSPAEKDELANIELSMSTDNVILTQR